MSWLPFYLGQKHLKIGAGHSKMTADADLLASLISRFSKDLVNWLNGIQEQREINEELNKIGEAHGLRTLMRSVSRMVKKSRKHDIEDSDWLTMLQKGNDKCNEGWFSVFLSNYRPFWTL